VHNRSVGDVVVITGAGDAGYNGTFTVASVPNARSFTFTNPTAGLPTTGGGTVTYSSPFQVHIGGNDSAVIGGTSQAYTATNVQNAINAIPGFAGTVTVTGLASTGFTVTYGAASAGVDVPNAQVVNLSCSGCFASVEETNHGGGNDSFTLNYNGNVSAPIVNGVNYTAAGITAALTPILPAGATATVAGFGGGAFNNTGFQVTYGGTLAATNVPVTLALQDFTTTMTAANAASAKMPPQMRPGLRSPWCSREPVSFIAVSPRLISPPRRPPGRPPDSRSSTFGQGVVKRWRYPHRIAGVSETGSLRPLLASGA
jgi:hypothetical protein